MTRPTSILALACSFAALFATSCSDSTPATKAPPVGAAASVPPAAAPDSTPEDADKKPEEIPPFAKVEGERGLRSRTAAALEGVTLISPLNSKQVHLVGMDGKPVHTWNVQQVPSGGCYFLPNGHLLRSAMVENNPRFHGGGIGGRIEELDWDGKLVWEYELATDQRTTHHDIALLPNGNVLAIAYEYHSSEEAFAKGRAMRWVHEEGLWCDVVVEIRPTLPKGGEIVWEWRSFDHLVQNERQGADGFGEPADFPGRIDINADHRFDAPETDAERKEREERDAQIQGLGYAGGKDLDPPPGKPAPDHAGNPKSPKKDKYDADWLHTNAIKYLPEQDLIALSTPHLSEIWVIDHSTTKKEAATSSGGKRGKGGELLYRWGNPRNYGCGDEATRVLYYQHDMSWQPGPKPGELALLLFNNGSKRPIQEFSEVIEFNLPFDPARGFVREAGKAFGPTDVSWKYNDPEHFFSPFISGAQRLSNGNTLICEGARGRVFEVTHAGQVVWDYYNPLGGEIKPAKQAGNAPAHALFRATRIAKDHPGLAGRL